MMGKEGSIRHSRRRVWFMLIVSLLDELALLALVFILLWVFRVKMTWYVILPVLLAVAGFFFLMHKAVIPSLLRPRLTGAEGMVGAVGEVTQPLNPQGVVKVGSEYWQARSLDGDIGAGETVEVVRVCGLRLEVRRKRYG